MGTNYKLKQFRYMLFWRFQYAKRSFWSKLLSFDFKDLIYSKDIKPSELTQLEDKLMFFKSFKEFGEWKNENLNDGIVHKGEIFNDFENFVVFLNKVNRLEKNLAVLNFICILEIILSWEDKEYGADTYMHAAYAKSNSITHQAKSHYDLERIPKPIRKFYPAYIGYSQNFGYFIHDLIRPFNAVEILESIKYEPDVIVPFYDIHISPWENFVLREIALYLYKFDNEPDLTDKGKQTKEENYRKAVKAANRHAILKNKTLDSVQNTVRDEINSLFDITSSHSSIDGVDKSEEKLVLWKRIFDQIKRKVDLRSIDEESINKLIAVYEQVFPMEFKITPTSKRSRAFGLVLWDNDYIYGEKRKTGINKISEYWKQKGEKMPSESFCSTKKSFTEECVRQNMILKINP